MKNKILFFLALSLSVTFLACQDDLTYTPKPRAYPKIEFPEKKYQYFDESYCQFKFEYPTYGSVIQDTLYFDERPKNPCWFDLKIKDLNAFVHCSYIPIGPNDPFDKLVSDAFSLTQKHNVKADYIDELRIQKPNNVSGYVFDVQGSVASPFQFYLTDSTQHFFRGSLYIQDKARPDSLSPIYEYLKADIIHMINTFEWTEE